MNYIKHLTGFFDKVVNDTTLNPTHISLYIALFQFWNTNRFRNPISISRDEVMRISKICSKATYHKCLKNLHSKGYIKYEPSYNPYRGSLVYLFNFSNNLKPTPKSKTTRLKNSTETDLVGDKRLTPSQPSNEHVGVPYINSINNTNNSNGENLEVQSQKIINKNDEILKNSENNSKQEKLRQKNKNFIAPNLEKVKEYFQEKKHPEIEAQKFFNYFSSIGWLVGGKNKMVDWKAAAENWMLNTSNFNNNTEKLPTLKANHLNIPNNKNYAEPL